MAQCVMFAAAVHLGGVAAPMLAHAFNMEDGYCSVWVGGLAGRTVSGAHQHDEEGPLSHPLPAAGRKRPQEALQREAFGRFCCLSCYRTRCARRSAWPAHRCALKAVLNPFKEPSSMSPHLELVCIYRSGQGIDCAEVV